MDQIDRLDVVVIHCDVDCDSFFPWALRIEDPTITPDPFMERELRCLGKLVYWYGIKIIQRFADLLVWLEVVILDALSR